MQQGCSISVFYDYVHVGQIILIYTFQISPVALVYSLANCVLMMLRSDPVPMEDNGNIFIEFSQKEAGL